jgi:general secretion pathway protein E
VSATTPETRPSASAASAAPASAPASPSAGSTGAAAAAASAPNAAGSPGAPGLAGSASRRLALTRAHVEEGLVSERDFLRALAERDGAALLERIPEEIVEPVPTSLPLAYLEEFLVVPLDVDERTVRVATALDLDLATEDEIGAAFERRVRRVYAPRAEVLDALRRFYGAAGDELDVVVQGGYDLEGGDGDEADAASLEDLANQAPVIRLVNFLILEAARRRASDIHFEALESSLKVRYRIDGRLQEVTTPPKKLQAAITSRIKIMGAGD